MIYEGLLRLAIFAQETLPYHRSVLFLWQGVKSIIQADEKGEGI